MTDGQSSHEKTLPSHHQTTIAKAKIADQLRHRRKVETLNDPTDDQHHLCIFRKMFCCTKRSIRGKQVPMHFAWHCIIHWPVVSTNSIERRSWWVNGWNRRWDSKRREVTASTIVLPFVYPYHSLLPKFYCFFFSRFVAANFSMSQSALSWFECLSFTRRCCIPRRALLFYLFSTYQH